MEVEIEAAGTVAGVMAPKYFGADRVCVVVQELDWCLQFLFDCKLQRK